MIYLKNSIRNIFCLVLALSEGRAIFKNALFSKVIVKYKIFFEFIRVSTILIFLVCSIIFAYFSKPKPPCFLVPCPRSVPLLILNMLRYTLIDTFKIMSFHFEKKWMSVGSRFGQHTAWNINNVVVFLAPEPWHAPLLSKKSAWNRSRNV